MNQPPQFSSNVPQPQFTQPQVQPQAEENPAPPIVAGFPAYYSEPAMAPKLETKQERKQRKAFEESQQAPGPAYSWVLSLLLFVSPVMFWLIAGWLNAKSADNIVAVILVVLWGFWWALTIVANVSDMVIYKTKRGSGSLFFTLAAPFIWLLIIYTYVSVQLSQSTPTLPNLGW